MGQQESKMNKLKSFFAKPLTAAILGVIIGLGIGLGLGWGLWPVQWYDLDASTLRQDLKTQYLCMIVDSYKVNKNGAVAAARLDAMGTNIQQSPAIFDYLQADGCTYTANDEIVSKLKTDLLSITPATGTSSQPTTPTSSSSGVSGIWLGLLCVLFLGIGAALIYIFFFRNKRSRNKVPPSVSEEGFEPQVEEDLYPYNPVQPMKSAEVTTDRPAAHFMTTFLAGDDLYDDSFSIDSANGEFLGECGVGISDTVGVGDPKKVSAFEVWLFDKNDIQTVTKVLMSSRSMSDANSLQRLSAKGEPILVEPGKQIMLETASLQLQAKVVEMVYGQGAMPTGSYFDRLTLELTVWPK
jgi:hypothetical protein